MSEPTKPDPRGPDWDRMREINLRLFALYEQNAITPEAYRQAVDEMKQAVRGWTIYLECLTHYKPKTATAA